jgi:glycosyltransferase involved in cell wall biosynthesis
MARLVCHCESRGLNEVGLEPRRRLMQSSLISVVIPTFNRESRMLSAAVESVLAQDVPSLDVIVVDDGSETSAAQVVEGYGDPVRFHEKQNGGIGSARNAGIVLSRGDLLAFLDSDDIWEPDKLARQVEALRSDSELEAVFGQAEQFYDTEVDDAFKHRHPIKNLILDAWLSSAMLIRREAFDRVGLFAEDRSVSPDVDWFLRANEAGLRVAMLPHVVYRRRIHTTNWNVTESGGAHSRRLLALKLSLDRRRAAERGAED